MTDLLVRLAVLLTIFASVFILSQVLLGAAWRNRARVSAVNKRLRMIREGVDRAEVATRLRKTAPSEFAHLPGPIASWLRSLQRMLFASAVPVTLSQMLLAIGVMFAVLLAVMLILARTGGYALGSGTILLLAVMAGCAAAGLPLLVMSGIAQRRRKKVEQQFPVALDVFVRALRSGHPIAAAIDLLTHEMEDPIGSEFGLVSDEVAYGAELTDALESMADRWDLEDMHMFVVSLSVQNETGGNLAEILENLSDVIRARASMYMKVRALSSEGRMTGWMLTVLPIFAFVSMFLINPGFYLDVARDPIFMIGFPSLIGLYLIGLFTIRSMVNLKV